MFVYLDWRCKYEEIKKKNNQDGKLQYYFMPRKQKFSQQMWESIWAVITCFSTQALQGIILVAKYYSGILINKTFLSFLWKKSQS